MNIIIDPSLSIGPRLLIDLVSLYLYSNSPLANLEFHHLFSIELSCPYFHQNTMNSHSIKNQSFDEYLISYQE